MAIKPLQFSLTDLSTTQGLERVLRQITIQDGPVEATLPPPAVLASLLAPYMKNLLQANSPTALNLTALTGGSGGSAALTEDTHANRAALYTPPSTINQLYWETDRTVLYVSINSSGSLLWRFASGIMQAAIASRPSDLGTADANFLFFATDQLQFYAWTGAVWSTDSNRILIAGFFAILTHANTADRTYTLIDATGSLPVNQSIALTAQVAAITTTNISNGAAGTTFRLSYYLETTTADAAAGDVTLTIAFVDAAGATTIVSATLALTAPGRTSGVFMIQRASGNISYAVALGGIIGTSQYALYIALERIT